MVYMQIIFTVEQADYEDFVSYDFSKMKRREIETGTELEVQLEVEYFKSCNLVTELAKIPTYKKLATKILEEDLRELRHLISNLYAFSGKIVRIISSPNKTEMIMDCGIPVRAYILRDDVVKRKILNEGSHLTGTFYLKGHISYDEGNLRNKVRGKVLKVDKFPTPPSDQIFITLDYPK